MGTPLLSPLASGQGLYNRLTRATGRGLFLAGLGLLGLAPAAQAQDPVLFGLGTVTSNAQGFTLAGLTAGDQVLLKIDPNTGAAISPTGTDVAIIFNGAPVASTRAPLKITYAVTPTSATQTLVGFDYRPNTGQAYALGYDAANQNPATTNAQLYVIDTTTGIATAVGSPMFLALGTTTDRVGFDFNPTVDRIRVVSTNDNNYRLNPTTGATIKDGNVRYASGTPANPGIGSLAYSNSFIGATSTIFYGLDEINPFTGPTGGTLGLLGQFSFPNQGIIDDDPAPVGTLLFGKRPDGTVAFENARFDNARAIDFDIYYDAREVLPADRNNDRNSAYLVEVNQNGGTNLYSYNLTTARADLIGNTIFSGVPIEIRDVAAQISAPTPPALTGQLLYALANTNLISFDSGNPGVIRSAVALSGITGGQSVPDGSGTATTAGQSVVGLDFRSRNGLLYALGYDRDARITGNNAQLYTVDLTTGAATTVNGAIRLELGNTVSAIGFDFNPNPNPNPVADRIRVTSAANRANYRLNPVTGAVVDANGNAADGIQADGTLTNDVSAVAYTNNDNDVNTGTTLFGYDQTTNFIVRSTNANAGTYVNADNGSGITVNAATGVDFDIFTENQVTSSGLTTNVSNKGFVVAATSADSGNDALYTVDLVTTSANYGKLTRVGLIGTGSNISNLAAVLTPTATNLAFTGLLTWDGSASTAWNVPLNWTPEFEPTAANDVLIPNVTNDPVVGASEEARTVTLGAGATLTSANGSELSVFGNFINNGGTVLGGATVAGSTGAIALTGPAEQTIGGTAPTTFLNLRVGDNGATMAAPVSIRRLITLRGDLRTNEQLFTLLSVNGTEQAQVVNVDVNVVVGGNADLGTVFGTATVQRSIDGTLNGQNIGYRHYSTPVSGNDLTDLNSTTGSGFTAVLNEAYNTAPVPRAVTPFPNVMAYDQDRITDPMVVAQTGFISEFDKGFFVPTTLNVGRGYAVNIADDVTVDFVGPLNQESSYTRGELSRTSNGLQFLGNPYPSALDWSKVSEKNVNVDNALYVYKSNGQYTGSYASVVNGVPVNGGSNIIPLGQGFFVRVSAGAGASSGIVQFDNADRVTDFDATPFQRGPADQRPTLKLALRTAAGRGEQAAIYFEQGATTAYDGAYDATHLAGPGAPLGLASAGNLSINGQPALSGADVLVPLEMRARTAGTYVLSADELRNLPTGYRAYLRDAVAGTHTDLTAQPRISLELTAGAVVAGHYAVLFSRQAQVLATAPAALAQLVSLYPNPSRNGATSLLLPAALRGGKATPVEVVNSLGQVMLRRTLAATGTATLDLPLAGLEAGIYTVRAHTAVGQVVKRLTVQ